MKDRITNIADPRIVGSLFVVVICIAFFVIPTYMLEVVIVIALSSIISKPLYELCDKIHIGSGMILTIVISIVLGGVALFSYNTIPQLVTDIQGAMQKLPAAIPAFKTYLLEHSPTWLKDMLPTDVEDDQMVADLVKKFGKSVLHGFYGSALVGVHIIGHLFLGLILSIFLIAGWRENTTRMKSLLQLFVPNQVKSLTTFGRKFQRHGVDVFKALAITALIFMVVIIPFLYFYGGLPLGKSLALGFTLGIASAIPAISGILTVILMLLIGIANYGISPAGIQMILTLMGFSMVMYFIEKDFLTPKIMGHAMEATPFYVFVVLVAAVLMFGMGLGIFAGLLSIVAFRALKETSEEYSQNTLS